jgi:hypothetical protein
MVTLVRVKTKVVSLSFTRPQELSGRLLLGPSALLLVTSIGLRSMVNTMQMLLPLSKIFGNLMLPSAGSLRFLSASLARIEHHY